MTPHTCMRLVTFGVRVTKSWNLPWAGHLPKQNGKKCNKVHNEKDKDGVFPAWQLLVAHLKR